MITITEHDGTHSKLGRDRLTLPRCYALRPRSSSSSGRLGSRPCRPLLLPSFLHSGNSPDEPAPSDGRTDRPTDDLERYESDRCGREVGRTAGGTNYSLCSMSAIVTSSLFASLFCPFAKERDRFSSQASGSLIEAPQRAHCPPAWLGMLVAGRHSLRRRLGPPPRPAGGVRVREANELKLTTVTVRVHKALGLPHHICPHTATMYRSVVRRYVSIMLVFTVSLAPAFSFLPAPLGYM